MRFFMCYFETTRECNKDCPSCMTRKDSAAGSELSTEEAKRLVIDEVAKICPTGSMAFSGGEFLLRPDAFELLDHAASRGLHSFVNTNGSMLDTGMVRAVKEAARGRVTFGFSLDSVEDDVQKTCRSGSRNEILDLFSLCDAESLGYFVLVTISRANLGTLDRTMKFLADRNVPMIRSPFVPRGAAAAHRDLMFTREDMENRIHPILRKNSLCYVSYAPFFAPPGGTKLGFRNFGISLGQLGCQAARGFVGVSPEGDVAPCVHLLDSAAVCDNVRRTPLSEMFRSNPVRLSLRDGRDLKGKGGICRYKHSCRGCRALAFHHTGDYLAEDPVCFFEPTSKKDRSPFEEETGRKTREFMDFVAGNRPWRDIFAGDLAGRIGASLVRSAAAIRNALAPARKDR